MSLNGGGLGGNGLGNSTGGMYSGFDGNGSGLANLRNQPMSPSLSHTSQVNGVGGGGGGVGGGGVPGLGMPMNAGQQMDLNHLYEIILELSDVLRNNRDMTKNIVTSAEDLMVGTFSLSLFFFFFFFCGNPSY